ncbi:MAG: four helix bundle protein [Patescibacteria group bacterium]|nr:four helix bundle protein [Patescibacteria group bacterium]MDD5554720.1 four helix bundle protein [Patescibacteria group bacterium]
MKGENIVKTKSYSFALRIIKLYKYLISDKKEFILSKQVLRSGTSIGANIEEAIGGQSRKDFFSKITVAYKEARETKYWISLLKDGKFLEEKFADSILNDCEELCKIIGKIQSTVKNKIDN